MMLASITERKQARNNKNIPRQMARDILFFLYAYLFPLCIGEDPAVFKCNLEFGVLGMEIVL